MGRIRSIIIYIRKERKPQILFFFIWDCDFGLRMKTFVLRISIRCCHLQNHCVNCYLTRYCDIDSAGNKALVMKQFLDDEKVSPSSRSCTRSSTIIIVITQISDDYSHSIVMFSSSISASVSQANARQSQYWEIQKWKSPSISQNQNNKSKSLTRWKRYPR